MAKREDVKFFLSVAKQARWNEAKLKDIYGDEL